MNKPLKMYQHVRPSPQGIKAANLSRDIVGKVIDLSRKRTIIKVLMLHGERQSSKIFPADYWEAIP